MCFHSTHLDVPCWLLAAPPRQFAPEVVAGEALVGESFRFVVQVGHLTLLWLLEQPLHPASVMNWPALQTVRCHPLPCSTRADPSTGRVAERRLFSQFPETQDSNVLDLST